MSKPTKALDIAVNLCYDADQNKLHDDAQTELNLLTTRLAQLEHALVTLYDWHYLHMRSMPEEWIQGVCKSAMPESHPAHSDLPDEYAEYLKEEWHKRL